MNLVLYALVSLVGFTTYQVKLVDKKPTHYEVEVRIPRHTLTFFFRANQYAFIGVDGRRGTPRWNEIDEQTPNGKALREIAALVR